MSGGGGVSSKKGESPLPWGSIGVRFRWERGEKVTGWGSRSGQSESGLSRGNSQGRWVRW